MCISWRVPHHRVIMNASIFFWCSLNSVDFSGTGKAEGNRADQRRPGEESEKSGGSHFLIISIVCTSTLYRPLSLSVHSSSRWLHKAQHKFSNRWMWHVHGTCMLSTRRHLRARTHAQTHSLTSHICLCNSTVKSLLANFFLCLCVCV